MKTDVNGCSTCNNGTESFEMFRNRRKRRLIQYDYRHHNGELFSCVGPTIEDCREKKDKWLKAN